MTILDLFDASVVERAPAPAIDDVSYHDLAAGTRRVAHALRERGLRPGDRIALYCENRLAFVYVYLAALRLGAIAVPANILYRASDLAHVLTDAAPAMVLASSQTRAPLGSVDAPPVVLADDVDAWAANAAGPACSGIRAQPEAAALIVYTSGTTGRSKGAVLSHGNLAAIAAQLVTAWRWTARDTLAIALPLFHLHGLGAALNGTLACGGRLLMQQRFDARAMLEVLRHSAVTMFFGVPTMYVRLLELPEDTAFPPLRLCACGSAALSADVFERFRSRFGITILERYGATEFGFALGNRFAGPRVPGSVGIPFPGVRVRIAASERGGAGELLVNGPNVFAGYWRDPAATAAAFTRDADGERWYRSGDLAVYDESEGVYRIVGRSRDLIVSGGFNVYPLEVEIEIDRLPGVRASAVIGVPDAVRGETVVAFVEMDEATDDNLMGADSATRADAMLAVLRDRLASFKLPKRLIFTPVLPRNALGKIEKTKLRERARAAGDRD